MVPFLMSSSNPLAETHFYGLLCVNDIGMVMVSMLEQPVQASPGPSSDKIPPTLGIAVTMTVMAGGVGALIIERGVAPTGVLVAATNLGVPVGTGVVLGGGDLDEVVTIVE